MKTIKDILFLCQYFYPEYISSATLPFDTALALTKAGFSVDALCGYPKEYNLTQKVPLIETHEDIKIKRVKYLQIKRNNKLGRLINYFTFTLAIAIRFGYLKNYKSIIVYSNPPVLPLIAALANKFFNINVVFVCYDVYPEIAYATNSISEDSIISKIMKIVNKNVFKQVNIVIALSKEMKEYLINHRPALNEQQVEVIPNWYEDKGRGDTKEPLNHKLFSNISGKFVVSYFGNMGIAQDLETIINAIKNLKEDNSIQFIFAGHGNKMELLKNIVENEKLENVYIYDFLHSDDFEAALNISDCFLVSLEEGLTGLAVPSKTYSYMKAGKPVIAIIGENSDIARDLIDNNAGFVIQVGESDKLENTITELRTNKEKQKLMGENCRKVFLEKYTKEQCTQLYVDLMRRLLGA